MAYDGELAGWTLEAPLEHSLLTPHNSDFVLLINV
jgi:hypothetical protein